MANALYPTNQSIPQEMLLGNLLFSNLIDMRIAECDLISVFRKNNIPESYVRKISKADAFRRASSSIKNQTLMVTGLTSGQDKVRIEIDEVRNDVDSIKRIIGVKRVDDSTEDIKYEPVGEIVFNRSSDTCSATPLLAVGDPDYQGYAQLCEDVANRYNDWSVYHNKDTVKNIINRIINDTHPVNLMPTGLCKFIPASSTALMYNLRSALSDLSGFGIGSSSSENIMEIIPVLDTDEQRTLVEKNFTAEITDELFSFTQELRNVLTEKQSLNTRTANSYVDKFKTLQNKAKEYESLLGIYVGAIHQQIVDALTLVTDNTDTN